MLGLWAGTAASVHHPAALAPSTARSQHVQSIAAPPPQPSSPAQEPTYKASSNGTSLAHAPPVAQQQPLPQTQPDQLASHAVVPSAPARTPVSMQNGTAGYVNKQVPVDPDHLANGNDGAKASPKKVCHRRCLRQCMAMCSLPWTPDPAAQRCQTWHLAREAT